MAVGSRAHLEKEALAKRSWARNFLMRGFHVLVLVVSGGAVRDTQCGFKVQPGACWIVRAVVECGSECGARLPAIAGPTCCVLVALADWAIQLSLV